MSDSKPLAAGTNEPMRPCRTSHHFACACREAKFRELLEAAEEAVAHGRTENCGRCGSITLLLEAAIKGVRS